jgi:excisionase family DNA binding protein
MRSTRPATAVVLADLDPDDPTAVVTREQDADRSRGCWLNRLTVAELSNMDEFDRTVLAGELAFRRDRITELEAATALLAANSVTSAPVAGPGVPVVEVRGVVDVGTLVDAVAARVRSLPAPSRSPDGLLSAREAAALLGVSHSTFRDVVRRDVPTVRIGGRVAFDRRDLERWETEHKEAGGSGSPRGAAVRHTSSGSAILDAATKNPRVDQIRARLLSKPRGSTRT